MTTGSVGFDGHGRGDVLGRTATGDLYLYPSGVNAFTTPVRVGVGWNAFSTVLSPGDWTGDGKPDILALTPSGSLFLYRGNGKGGFLPGSTLIATGWASFTDLVAPGDWTGDGKPDLLARKANGELWLVPGNGAGGFSGAPRLIGTGWQMFSQLVTPGDVTGDHKPDLLGRTPSGALYLFVGTGKASGTAAPGMLPRTLVSTGWQAFNTVLSAGDLTGDGRPDLVARTPGNLDYVFAGTGRGTFLSAVRVSAPWGASTRIFGVP